MAELKTHKTKASVSAFLDAIEDPQQRKDAKALAKIMRAATGERAAMWGEAIVGYGSYAYQYASGRSGVWLRAGFSPRKGNLTVYIMPGFAQYSTLMKALGKHPHKYKLGKSCLYIKKLADVDVDVLQQLVRQSMEYMETKYPS